MVAPDDYCREIERYLCRKNDGHLIRIVGPAFELVAGWAQQGIPLKVACAGIDRLFERYYRKGPRRRPVRIEFCEADVLDAFDAWRRAVGVTQHAAGSGGATQTADGADEPRTPRRPSLGSHLERSIARLTALRAGGAASGFDAVLERTARVLDSLRPEARHARGDARAALITQLAVLDRALLSAAIDGLDADTRKAAEAESREALAPFRDRMAPEAFQRACAAAFERHVRQQYDLPTVTYETY